ncbi:hypothetical protein [Bacillus phage Megatron]|uniref:Uncharacterized protein n=4 Tax=Wphvirus megatron TaxID=1987728 RepID=A0A024B3D5_9CAUD|nr:hypothetical protein FP75_gp084 [Bacillus phage Megatron]YP_009212030.1 hypothetical protein QLX47_gp090 [Bacillus phage Eyuki]YP_009280891.1 hypothetical protein SAGEFAYGE_88 [Bacillus phage SageFayge]YP_009285032.1 hypothetical protein BIZ88_gp090 [Bacillus phage DirtyBetty]AHZ10666.1 hypothetical protein [Bacillus phage Megatron]ALA46746.1 hypothetical protein EYUKI_90 [Bacillus phage Eyuki]AMW63008.1 hypothetical protein SAGEFAYGE_88 [Bacillus phage SageFayge]ANT41399.1 hypothetical p
MTVSIESLNKELEVVEKSMELAQTEVVVPDPVKVEEEVEVKEEEKVEEVEKEKEEEVKEEEKSEEEVVEKSAKKEDKKDEKEKDKEKEEVEKSDEEDEKEDVEKSDEEDEGKEKEKKEKKDEKVAKSAEALPTGSEFITFLESVVKSTTAVAKNQESVVERLERIEKSVLPMIENIAKHVQELKAKEVQEAEVVEEVKEDEGKVELDVPETKVEEEVVVVPEAVAKSANEDEDLDGKGVEYIEKSANAPEAAEVEEEIEEVVFKAADHVGAVIDYVHAGKANPTEKGFLFGVVNRVKGGYASDRDVAAVKAIVDGRY